MPEETVGATDTVACECEPCKRKHGQPHNVHSGTIHAYSSTPRNGWQVRRTTAELAAGTTAPTFGLELETAVPSLVLRDLPGEPPQPYRAYEVGGSLTPECRAAYDVHSAWAVRNRAHRDRQRAAWAADGNLTADEAVSCAAPRGLWHPKHDGSVTGPEFASQPGTLAYWRSIRPHIANMTRALLHGGMRSHDGDTCGLHVNIGADAFGDSGHLCRFMDLVAANPRWTTRMAQRTNGSMRSWANFGNIETASQRADLARTWRDYGYAHTNHSSCVNLSHAGRVEFRIPRGTLRLDRLYAKLEWVAAMVEYTRDAAHSAQPSAFMHWSVGTGEYPELARYMAERFPARLEGVAS